MEGATHSTDREVRHDQDRTRHLEACGFHVIRFSNAEIHENLDGVIETILSELERKHEALEREIHDVIARPAADTARVAELKRRKLQLKDEIYRLKRTTH